MRKLSATPFVPILFALSLSLAATPAPSHAGDAGTQEILLGQSLSLSGRWSRNATLYRQGALLYFDDINAAGGIHGRRIRLLTLDDRSNSQLVRSNTAQLIAAGKILALFGYSGTAPSLAALPLAMRAGVPFFAPRAGSPLLHKRGGRMLFTVRAGHRRELDFLLRQIAGMGLDRVALLHPDDAQGYADVSLAAELLYLYGGNLVAGVPSAGPFAETFELEEIADALLRSAPKAILINGDVVSSAAIIRTLRARRYAGVMYAMSQAGGKALAEQLGEMGKGVAVTQTVPFPWRGSARIAVEYREAAKAAGGLPSFVGLEGYIAAKVLCEGLRRSGRQPTREKLVQALESINDRNYDVGGFSINFSASSHDGSQYVDTSAISHSGAFVN